MFDKLISELQRAVPDTIVTTSGGTQYSTVPLLQIKPPQEPLPDALEIHTLSGLMCFLTQDDWASKGRQAFIHVNSPNKIAVLSQIYGIAKQRDVFCVVKHEPLFGTDFSFGKYYEQETFIIGLQTLFEKTENRDRLLSIVGKIKSEEVREAFDDGVSQEVAVKVGQVLVQAITVPNPIILKPFRTFREVKQPESPFVVRLKRVAGGLPQIALYECDGGMWKVDAMNSIADYIKERVPVNDKLRIIS
jgi:hypothetical protein